MRGIAERRGGLALEDFLDGLGCLSFGKACAVSDAEDVRIDRKCLCAKSDVEDDIGSLTADAGKRLEQVAIRRHFAAMLVDEDLRQRDDVLCFVIEKANRFDVVAHGFQPKIKHRLRIIGNGEQRPRRFVHADISRLRRQNDCDEQRVDID